MLLRGKGSPGVLPGTLYAPSPGLWAAAPRSPQPGRVEADEGDQCAERGLRDQVPPAKTLALPSTPPTTCWVNQPPSSMSLCYRPHVLHRQRHVSPTVWEPQGHACIAPAQDNPTSCLSGQSSTPSTASPMEGTKVTPQPGSGGIPQKGAPGGAGQCEAPRLTQCPVGVRHQTQRCTHRGGWGRG